MLVDGIISFDDFQNVKTIEVSVWRKFTAMADW